MSADVLVVGAGPVGLLTALELARQRVDVGIVDARAHRGTRSKATTIWPRQLELLARHGLAAPVIEEAARIDRVTVSTPGRRLAAFSLAELPDTTFRFGVSIPQPRFEALLEKALADLGVTVERESTLVGLEQEPDRVLAVLRDARGVVRTETAGFVVGADGMNSTVREQAAIRYVRTGPTLTFAITDVPIDGPIPAADVGYYYSPAGALGLVPMGDGVFRIALGVRADGPDLGRDGFAAALRDRAGHPATLGDLPWEAHFDVRFQHTTAYARGRVALAGDAAHTMSPAGGQGMNTGLQDAANLGWRLAAAVHERAAGPEIDALLAGYTAERRPDVERVMETSRLLTRFGADRTWSSRLQREALAVGARVVPSLRRSITTRIAQLATSYAPPSGPRGRLRPGDRFPPGFADDWGFGARTYHWRPAAPPPRGGAEETLLVAGRLPPAVVKALGKGPAVVSVRPDGHIRHISSDTHPALTRPGSAS
jgi:2-polyprenyl-6-methoxyphenol hydroxylase-like FAD-dependent oxidoreductase